jgi:histidine ammonia-lyase
MSTVTITDAPMSVEELLAVAEGAPVELAPSARATIQASRTVVDKALAGGDPIYGLTTQVGHGKDVRVSDDQLRRQQETLIMTHAGGVGPPLATRRVRAALAARLNGIARGGSGASLAAAEVLAAMLNAGVHPVVPATGSVGAGDITQMAIVAQVVIGRGRAEHRGETLPGGEALRRAGIAPLVLEGKDGLALLSANSLSIGDGALAVHRAARAAGTADVAAALSMEAIGANPSVVLPAVAAAKPFPGQVEAAAHLRDLLAGSHLLERGAAHSVQDPLSFRVAPQVHGALREQLAAARRAVEIELNSASDNPLVSLEEQTLISNGNFHPMVLAIAFDALRVAIAHVGQLGERRLSHLWDRFFQLMDPAGFPGDGPPPPLPGLQLRYPAAALLPELKQLAAPATLDVPSLDMGVEDHGTGAPLSVRKADEALALLDDLLAVELLLARDVLAAMPDRPTLGAGTGHALRLVEEVVAITDPVPDAVHRALSARLAGLEVDRR